MSEIRLTPEERRACEKIANATFIFGHDEAIAVHVLKRLLASLPREDERPTILDVIDAIRRTTVAHPGSKQASNIEVGCSLLAALTDFERDYCLEQTEEGGDRIACRLDEVIVRLVRP